MPSPHLSNVSINPNACVLTGRLPPCVCRRQLASGIYSFACSLWSHHTDCFLQQICARDEAAALGSLERTLLSLKGNAPPPPPDARPSRARDLFKILTRKHESDPLSRAKCSSASRCDGGRKNNNKKTTTQKAHKL